jgi:hypothetical protein
VNRYLAGAFVDYTAIAGHILFLPFKIASIIDLDAHVGKCGFALLRHSVQFSGRVSGTALEVEQRAQDRLERRARLQPCRKALHN